MLDIDWLLHLKSITNNYVLNFGAFQILNLWNLIKYVYGLLNCFNTLFVNIVNEYT